jgi:cytoskeletal protein RodZ
MRPTSVEPAFAGHERPAVPLGQVDLAPPGRDEQIGQIFRNMRSAMKVSRDTIARRLATNLTTVDNFEAGAVTALPHWKETERIVRGYCELLRLDPEPILWRIREQTKLCAAPPRPVFAPPPPPPPEPTFLPTTAPPSAASLPEPELGTALPARRRRRAGSVFALSVPVALLLIAAILAQVAPGSLYRGASLLPPSLASGVRAAIDYIVLFTAPHRDGLRWIDVRDPRLRKADKLQLDAR